METIKRLLALMAVCGTAHAETYTVIIRSQFAGPELERFTNAVSIVWNHEKKEPPCHLIRYVRDGRTNEFHAWMVNVTVRTNKANVK